MVIFLLNYWTGAQVQWQCCEIMFPPIEIVLSLHEKLPGARIAWLLLLIATCGDKIEFTLRRKTSHQVARPQYLGSLSNILRCGGENSLRKTRTYYIKSIWKLLKILPASWTDQEVRLSCFSRSRYLLLSASTNLSQFYCCLNYS